MAEEKLVIVGLGMLAMSLASSLTLRFSGGTKKSIPQTDLGSTKTEDLCLAVWEMPGVGGGGGGNINEVLLKE